MRLVGFDYSEPGSYFLTICTNDSKHYFGEIQNHKMLLNEAGSMLYREWEKLENYFENIIPQEFIVMPNHIHGIIKNRNCHVSTNAHPSVGAYPCDRPCADEHKVHPYGTQIASLGRIVQAYKSRTTVEYIKMVENKLCEPFPGKLWQKNYFERVIRDEKDYKKIAEYILHNPVQWDKDEENWQF